MQCLSLTVFRKFNVILINRYIRQCQISMCNEVKSGRRSMSSKFVDRVRLQQQLKTSGSISPDQYSNGQYLIYVREGGLVMISNKMNDLKFADFQGLIDIKKDVQQEAMLLALSNTNHCRFAIEFPTLSPDHQKKLENQFSASFVNLRISLFLLSAEQSALVSQGKTLLRWRRKRNFCPECGGSMKAVNGWSHKICTACDIPQYPQMSPVSIALVEDEGHERALLVRQPRHPPGMFSCLAGFIDIGESVEQSVEREVGEEVGLDISSVQYLCSQHWPHPAPRLMLGCIATAKSGNVDIDKEELEAAAWFSPPQLSEALQRATSRRVPSADTLWLPPPGALAHTLISWWLKTYHNKK